MDLHIDLRCAIRETRKDEILVTNVEPAHVTAAADGGRPEIKSDMGSFIILARQGATPGSSKWLVVFDPLAQACQNSLKSTAVCEEAFFLCHPGIARLARGRSVQALLWSPCRAFAAHSSLKREQQRAPTFFQSVFFHKFFKTE